MTGGSDKPGGSDQTGGSDKPGGFRWNITPSSTGDGKRDGKSDGAAQPSASTPVAPVEPSVSQSTPPAERAATVPAAPVGPTATAPATPVDDWDVPTAASPVVGRSVFPMGPPAGAPALLLPPYVPPPAALRAPAAPPLPPPLDSSLEGVTELLGAHPVGLPDPVNGGLETSDIDVVFAESKFVDYDALPPNVMPPTYAASGTFVAPPVAASAAAITGLPGSTPPVSSPPFGSLRPPPASAMAVYEGRRTVVTHVMPRSQRILIGVAGALVVALALVALFLLGMRIGESTPVTGAVVTPTLKPSPTATTPPVGTVGPVMAGDHSWEQLLGGECLTLYESPWQDTFMVVKCTEPHIAQLLSKSTLPDAVGVAYPTTADLQSRITLACSATTVLDYAAAGAFNDIQLAASFPANAGQWDSGNRTTYCFATRAGGGELRGSLALAAAP